MRLADPGLTIVKSWLWGSVKVGAGTADHREDTLGDGRR